MIHETTAIETADGRCDAHVFHPEGGGPRRGVLVFMDAMGLRPAMFEIAERIASAGYHVLLPNLFYRLGQISLDAQTMFMDAEKRVAWLQRVLPTVSAENVMRDTEAFLTYFERAPDVKRGPIAITGYCMGGRLALSAAGTFGDRIAAAASYHGGNLATDNADSPHLHAAQMSARIYVGGAMRDAGFDDEQKARLEQALTDAGVRHTIETYNARHGWVPSDTPVHNKAEAERHWTTLLGLLADELA